MGDRPALNKYGFYPDETTEGERIRNVFESMLWLISGTVPTDDINLMVEFLEGKDIEDVLPYIDNRENIDIAVRFLESMKVS